MIVLARCGNGYCGCDSEEAFFFNDSMDEVEINEEMLSWAQENAESFAYVHFGWGESYTDEEYEDYLENYVEFTWNIASYEEYVEWCENWGNTPMTKEEIEKYLSA